MNILVAATCAIVCCFVVAESRYPYEDTYKAGDVVPYGYEDQRTQVTGPYVTGRYNPRTRSGIFGNRRRITNGYDRRREGDYGYSREYYRRRNVPHLPPRGIGGYSRSYDDYDFGGGGYRRHNSRGPLRYYDDEEFLSQDRSRHGSRGVGVDVGYN